MEPIKFRVYGIPKAGGNKKPFLYKSKYDGKMHAAMCEGTDNKSWREAVKQAALEAYPGTTLIVPLSLTVTFLMPRPMGDYKTGKNAGMLKDNAPYWHIKKPDVDKLIRSTKDAITDSGLWKDDSIVCTETKHKIYANDRPGCIITIQDAPTKLEEK